ncbi:MAG: N-acetyl-gamma-glutamyl-phosphate reductase, partial [Deltaproteobacteria bacterium]|nr:N-acetyl-gamma-glutamyl-phosphate reductase [Deltaproteobacteria bacterium]
MRIGVIGASGYAGLELLRILSGRQGDQVTLITSRQEAGQSLTAFYPALASLANYDSLVFSQPNDLAGQAEVFFLATQHGAAMALVPELLNSGAKVIDLSADFRLKDALVFKKWYLEHGAPELLPEAVYGLPELYSEQIKKARLIANPGCYPTSVILALAPVIKARLVDFSQTLIADSKSGVSGAGRGALLANSFCEVQDNFKSYKTVGHRHTPEMIQELSLLAGVSDLKLAFTPHLLPINRGILSTVYFKALGQNSFDQIFQVYQDFYQKAPFVRLRQP